MEKGKGEMREIDRPVGKEPVNRESNTRDVKQKTGIAAIDLDDWQKDILKSEGNLCILSGRQVGKSTVVAIKASEYVVKNPKKFVLIVSFTEKQAEEMLIKIMDYMSQNYKTYIKKGKDKPTKHQIKINNGSVIRCEPVGQTGHGIRGFTCDMVIADEAAFMPEAVWSAITPMLFTTNGSLILISTPNTKEGFFYKAYTEDETFKKFYINAEEVANMRPEPKRGELLEYLKREKITKSKMMYEREYLGHFVDDLRRLFSDEIIKKAQVLKRRENFKPGAEYYLGVDVAWLGGDETTFEIFERLGDKIFHVENIAITETPTTFTVTKILELNRRYNFKKIYIDGRGVGAGVLDQLLKESETKRKVESIDNARKSLDNLDESRRKTMKEDLYMNLLRLMERGDIQLLDDDNIFLSLSSVVYEHNEKGMMRIYGRYTHIAEGVIRGVWTMQKKSLSIWIDSIRV